jgi:type IV secretion system protein VirD4
VNTAPLPTVPRWPQPPGPGGGLGERVALVAGAAITALAVLVWATGQLAGLLFGAGWPAVAFPEVGGVLVRLPAELGDPAAAWPADARRQLPGPLGMYASATLIATALAAAALGVMRAGAALGPRLFAGRRPARAAAWATPAQLRPLVVRRPTAGRLTLGRSHGRLLAAEARQSVVVVAPTQSLKTTGLAVPAILEWDGPVLAASVKSDLLRDTLACRRALGQVHVYDPTGATGIPSSGWSPLAGCADWQGAQRVAAWLCAAAQPGRSALSDADFWYAAAAKLLAPVLFAAAASGRSMAEVVRWVDTQEHDELRGALLDAGVEEALIAAEATWRRDERQRSSIYTTAETVLAAYADPGVLASAYSAELTSEQLLDGGHHTAYLCAPAHEQARLRPLFATLIQDVLAAVYARASRTGAPLDPPLLVVLDEAANIAPLRDLDTLASTAAGQGIQLVSVFQDLAQVRERWGERAQTIVNNHRAKIIGAGIADPATLDYAARVLGDEEIRQVSSTAGQEGRASKTESTTWRALAPAHALRQAPPGTGVLVYGHLPPTRLTLRPWFADRRLRTLAAPPAPQSPEAHS